MSFARLRLRCGRLASLFAVLAAIWPAGARANDFDQFQNARVAYDSQNYELAADLFQGLLASATPQSTQPLVLESRKYLGATLLFLGKPHEAEAQFELLLRAEPDYVLDPLTFPEEVNRHFNAVRKRLERARAEAAAARARSATQRQADQAKADEDRKVKLKRLIDLASTERVERQRSRWIALLPFGVGQFQNDHNGLGLVLAVSEGTLLGAAVVSYVLHESLSDEQHKNLTSAARDDARLAEAAFRYSNQISIGLFAVVAVTGIIDAQLRFRPSHSYDQPRPLPPDLRNLDLSLTPTGFRLRGHF